MLMPVSTFPTKITSQEQVPNPLLLPDDEHAHGHHAPYEEPKTFADYVKPEYWYR